MDSKSNELDARLESIEQLLKENNQMIKDIKESLDTANKQKVYTGKEIYELKKSLSWKQLSLRTSIPISTLQHRYRKYINSELE